MKSVLESLNGSIADFIVAIFSFIFLLIDSVVYAIVGWAYDMFTIIAGARVLDESALRDLADRIYIVIGVIALFIVAYALLQAIIDPDKASKGDTSLGKIIPNIAIAIVGIAIVPTIFNYAYDVQRMILCNNIIPKLLLDNSISYDDNGYYKSENSGAKIATLLFESFFYPKNNDGGYANVSSEKGYIQMLHDTHGDFTGGDLGQAYEDAKKGGWFWTTFSPFIDDIAKGNVGYLIIISTIAGGYCAYVLITYCFDAAIRAVKLAYLEILAPLPLLLMIVPGQKKIFQNWLKKTLSCFFEIFIRIFAIVFVAFIMRHLPDLIFNMSSMFNNGYGCLTNPGFIKMLLIRALLINALFAFMKQAPKLVSDITGIDSKGFSIGLKGKGILGDALGTLGGVATGAATGALGAGWSSAMNTKGGFKNKLAGFGAGAKYGAANGAKKGGNQFDKMRAQHYTDVLHGKGKAGVFGGQAYIDSQADATRKAIQKSYNKAVEDRVTSAPEFVSKMNEQMGGHYAEFNQKASELKEKYNKAQENYDNNGKDLLNKVYGFEASDTYKNTLNSFEQFAKEKADEEFNQKMKNKEYGLDPLSNPNYYRDKEARIEEIKRNKTQEMLRNLKRDGIASPEVKEYLNSIDGYNTLVDNLNNSKAQYDAVQDNIDATKNSTLEYFANLDTSDARLTSLKNDADFTIKRRNEKIADDYVKSVEGQKEVAARVEAEKTIGKPNSGQGTAKAPGDDKAGGSK